MIKHDEYTILLKLTFRGFLVLNDLDRENFAANKILFQNSFKY